MQGIIPEITLECIQILRRVLPKAKISVEVEKPGRQGLRELAAEADVIFYSKAWAEVCCNIKIWRPRRPTLVSHAKLKPNHHRPVDMIPQRPVSRESPEGERTFFDSLSFCPNSSQKLMIGRNPNLTLCAIIDH